MESFDHMVRLDRMEISGFKSFGDRTEVRFPAGITAVVGPNGCGKSNIGDAINWVLGEQSPKMLRGRQMVDVIFSGTAGRKPLATAEVSLHLMGAEGLPHADGGKAVLTRRLYRSGESEYLLNGSRARLRDIQSLLRDARIGARTYATIEQGRIDEVLNAKPKERRLLIEDAAGIAGYKHKRRLTEMKLDATQANLLRVHDIVTEVRRQINSMKRQAGKARRYQRLREELRERERLGFAIRAQDAEQQLRRLVALETEARDAEVEAAAGTGRLEVAVNDERLALERANETCRATAEQLHRLDIEIDREEGQVRNCRERIAESAQTSARLRSEAEELEVRRAEAESRLAAHRGQAETRGLELAELEARLGAEQAAWVAAEGAQLAGREQIEELRRQQFESMHRTSDLRNRGHREQEALERNRQQHARLMSEKDALDKDRSHLESRSADLAAELLSHRERLEHLQAERRSDEERLATARQDLADLTRELAESRERQKSEGAELRTLEDVATRFAGFSDGVTTLLESGTEDGVRTVGVVADFIEAGSDVECAAEGYLRWFLPTVILEDESDVDRAVGLLRSKRAGRTTFITRQRPVGRPAVGAPSNGSFAVPESVLSDPRVLGRLKDRVRLDASLNGAVQDRLGEAVLVDSIGAALDIHRRHPQLDYLTPEGDIVYASGVISVSGADSENRGLLAHNRRVQETRQRYSEASQASAGLEDRTKAAREELLRLELRLREVQQELDRVERRTLELDMQTRSGEEEQQRTGRRNDIVDDELAANAAEFENLNRSLGAVLAETEEADAAHAALEARLDESSQELDGHERTVKELGDRVATLRADLAARGQRQEAFEQEGARLDESLAELLARVQQLQADAAAADTRGREASELLERTEKELEVHHAERKTLAEKTAALEREITERQTALAERERELRDTRGDLESVREKTREAELSRARIQSAREHLDDLCRQELGFTAGEALAEAGDAIDDVEIETLNGQIDELKEKIERIGPVNLAAIEEFSELEERHAFLVSQQDDLDQSMNSLRETIRRINRQSRDKFAEAFEAISRSFQEVFKLLFSGGRASLRLEEGEDVLECGIEIMAQPPGKRLANLALLSGGEKALSAIALLFAVFQYQPSPFCLLDEVDAALDEANVARFSRLLREYSGRTQFILITHNKVTMENADLLYGVTMEEPGVSRLISLQLED